MNDFNRKFPSQEVFAEYFSDIDRKITAGKTLSLEEKIDWCSCLKPEYIEEYSFCDDQKFKDLFLDHHYEKKTGVPLSADDKEKLDSFLPEWKEIVQSGSHSEELLNIAAKRNTR